MSSQLDTRNGNNWTVIVFHCLQSRWTKILVSLFEELNQTSYVQIPHFTIRRNNPRHPNQLFISLRILRNHSFEKDLHNKITNLLKSFQIPLDNYRIDPQFNEQGDIFESRHCWIAKGSQNDYWNFKRCKILNDLSKIAKDVAKKEGDNKNSRLNFAHLAYNMLGIDERLLNLSPRPPRFYY
jgi:hypothetical protein